MRMRNKKHAFDRINALGHMLLNHVSQIEDIDEPHIEIGCGKGGFITALAFQNPRINYVAIEKNTNVMVLAMEKAADRGVKNIKFLLGDATSLEGLVRNGFCSRIYLNFSDPWPKKKQAKRRLTAPFFLNLYDKIMLPDGEIHFKTDNKGLFEYSLESFSQNGFCLKDVCLDLHNLNSENNIMTEYERLFSAQGAPIYKLTAYKSEPKNSAAAFWNPPALQGQHQA